MRALWRNDRAGKRIDIGTMQRCDDFGGSPGRAH